MKKLFYLSYFIILLSSNAFAIENLIIMNGLVSITNSCNFSKRFINLKSDDIQKYGCSNVISCKENTDIVNACNKFTLEQKKILAAEFVNDITKSMLASENCKGIKIYDHWNGVSDIEGEHSAYNSKNYWSLDFNFIPERESQTGSLFHRTKRMVFQIEGTSEDIAKKVCIILNRKGATIE